MSFVNNSKELNGSGGSNPVRYCKTHQAVCIMTGKLHDCLYIIQMIHCEVLFAYFEVDRIATCRLAGCLWIHISWWLIRSAQQFEERVGKP